MNKNIISKQTTIAVWEGEKLTKERALAVTGTVYWLQDFERYYSK
jgi:hypothetical protein